MVTQRDTYQLDVRQALTSVARLAAAWATVKIALVDSVKAFAVQEQAERKLAQALRNTGHEVDRNLASLKAQASAIQEISVVGDETIISLQAQALAMGVTTDKMDEAIRAAVGISNALGTGLTEAMRKVATATGKTRVELGEGFSVDIKKGSDAITQLNERFGEFVKATGSNADRMRQTANLFGGLQKQVGGLVLGLADAVIGFDNLKVALEGANQSFAAGGLSNFLQVFLQGEGDTAANEMQKVAERTRLLTIEINRLRGEAALLDDDAGKIAGASGRRTEFLAAAADLIAERDKLERRFRQLLAASQQQAPPGAGGGAGRGSGGRGGGVASAGGAFRASPVIRAAIGQTLSGRQTGAGSVSDVGDSSEFERLQNSMQRRNRMILDAGEDLNAGSAAQDDERVDASKASFDHLAAIGVAAYQNIANAIISAALAGDDMVKAIGSQLIAMGTQWLIAAPVHAFIPGMQTAAIAEAIGGPVAIAAGIAMGGASKGGSTGGGRGRGGGGARSFDNRGLGLGTSDAEPMTSTTNIYLQGINIVREQEGMSILHDAERRSGLGLRRGAERRSAF